MDSAARRDVCAIKKKTVPRHSANPVTLSAADSAHSITKPLRSSNITWNVAKALSAAKVPVCASGT